MEVVEQDVQTKAVVLTHQAVGNAWAEDNDGFPNRVQYRDGDLPVAQWSSFRLTDERWAHIVDNHDEMTDRSAEILEVLERPEWITRGSRGALVAWKGYGRLGYLCVHYKELADDDGFVITAYFARKAKKEHTVWPK